MMSKGSRIKAEKHAQAEQHAAQVQASEAKQAKEAENTPKYNAFTNPKNINWVILSGAMALLILALLFVPQQLGAGITSVYSVMLWTGLFGATLARYMVKNGWMGFFFGSACGMLLHIFAPVIQALLA